MGLFSFGKKDDSGRDAYPDSSCGVCHTARTERRTRRPERTDADAMMLDSTLPEKQRARRRLVGAVALVLATVIVLPMVLDSQPKPVTDDISIDIPNRPVAASAKKSREATDAETQSGVAHDGPAASGSVSAGVTQPQLQQTQQSQQALASALAAQAKADVTTPEQPKAEFWPAPSAAAKPKTPEPAAEPLATAANTPSSPAGSRFVLQIGQFDDETAAQNWVNKLKGAGVPAYLEHRKQADGSTKSLLRAGPFPDRASAQSALAKVKQAGLGGGARQTN